MSRIGRKPITIPPGAQVELEGATVRVKGPRGTLTRTIHSAITVAVHDSQVRVSRTSDEKRIKALHGLERSELQNMLVGVTEGYRVALGLSGVGYRAQMQEHSLALVIGYSHPVTIPIPAGIEVKTERNVTITVQGIDKHLVGQMAATIRAHRPPEPYKGRGIRYAEESIRRKDGKGRTAKSS